MDAKKTKENLVKNGLTVQDDLFAIGVLRNPLWLTILLLVFGLWIGLVIYNIITTKTYWFTLVDGQLIQTQAIGKTLLIDDAKKINKEDIEIIKLDGILGNRLTLKLINNEKQMFSIQFFIVQMKNIVNKIK